MRAPTAAMNAARFISARSGSAQAADLVEQQRSEAPSSSRRRGLGSRAQPGRAPAAADGWRSPRDAQSQALAERRGLARIQRRAPGASRRRAETAWPCAVVAAGQHLAKLRRRPIRDDRRSVGPQPAGASADLPQPQPRRELAQAGVVGGQRMGLQAGDDLQLVFDVAQEQISVARACCARSARQVAEGARRSSASRVSRLRRRGSRPP